jgi:tetratricopeptide (TPR) repeat protein
LRHQGGGISQRVQDLVRSRLQNLTDPARQTLEALAILGDGAGLALIRKVSGRSLEESADSLEHLSGVGLLRQLEEGASYGHDIVREVVQSDTKPVRRSLLNLRAAKARKAFPLRAAQHYFLSSEAWDDEGETSDTDAARKSYLEAAAQLTLRGELEEGLRWFDRALEISENLKTRIQIGLQKVATYERYGRYREALAALEVAEGLLLEVSDPILEAGALVAKARIIQQDGHYHPAVDLSQRALVLLGDRSSEASQVVRSEALVIMGWSHYLWKNLDTALELYQQSLELRKNLPDRSKMAGTLGSIGLILSKMGHEDAEKYLLECLSIREVMGDISGVSKALNHLGEYYFNTQQYHKSEEFFNKVLNIQKRSNDFHRIVLVLCSLSGVRLIIGDYDKSINYSREAMDISIKNQLAISEDIFFNLSEALLEKKQLEEAFFYASQLKNQIKEKEMTDTPIWGDCLELLVQIQDKINLSHTSSA